MTQITTPKGRARWPKLNEPDRKFNHNGEYSAELALEGEDAEQLKAKLEAIYEKEYERMCIREGKKKLKRCPLPIKAVTDQNGEETGETGFRFKLKALVETRDGRSWEQRPDLFDAQGNCMSEAIGGGSLIRISSEPAPWYTVSLGFGLTLRLRGVQVLELKAPSGGDATSYGFEKEEGFETSEDFAAQFSGVEDTSESEDF